MSDILNKFRADVRRAKPRSKRLREIADATGLKFKTLRNYYYIDDREGWAPYVDKLREFYERP